MLIGVYQKGGIRVRNHCGAEPPRDTKPAGLVATVGGRDRASTSHGEAGFVEAAVEAQRRLYRLKPEPFQEVDAWLAPFRRFWSAHVDALERHLDIMEKKKGKEKTTRPRPRT